ncbi:MAG: class I SAM-dependent methyltransferase [Paracoccaceae bacterium]|nr:class I SAM-dependent methyltransferase [Paracoccaceae bacterium]
MGLDPDRILAPLVPFLPAAPAPLLEIGAGPGRDAAWFAGWGHSVTAVEPVAGFRKAGRAHTGPAVRWIDSALPDLRGLPRSASFAVIYAHAVWQHITPDDRPIALSRMRGLLGSGGVLLLSLRFGANRSGRVMHQIDESETLRQADTAGFSEVAAFASPSLQDSNRRAGVTWRWVVLRA